MSIIGAALIMLGCTAAGLIKAHSLGEKDKTCSELLTAFTLLKSEICSRAVPLDEALRVSSGTASGDTEKFLRRVSSDFSKLGERSFCDIWSNAAVSCLQILPPRSLSAVKALGSSLGRYESSMQCAALDRCIGDISAEQQKLRETLSADKRMYIGLGCAAGLIIAIVLI